MLAEFLRREPEEPREGNDRDSRHGEDDHAGPEDEVEDPAHGDEDPEDERPRVRPERPEIHRPRKSALPLNVAGKA